MPLVGFRCPKNVPTAGRENTPGYCIDECPQPCLPSAVINAIWAVNDSNPHKGNMLSATALKGCPRKLVLVRKEPYYEEPPKLYHSTRGTLIHGFLEAPMRATSNETRLYKVVDNGRDKPWVLSGQIDCYRHEKRRLEDYKTMTDKGLYILFRDGYKEDHALQLNVYRWLMWGGHLESPSGEQVFWPVDDAVIHYLMMGRVISTGRQHVEIFSERSSPNYGKPFGREVSRSQQGKNLNGTPQWHVVLDMPSIPLLPLDEVQDYVETMGPGLVKALNGDNIWPAAEARNDPTRAWECDWCPVKRRCDEIEEAQRFEELEASGAQLELYDDMSQAPDLQGDPTAEFAVQAVPGHVEGEAGRTVATN